MQPGLRRTLAGHAPRRWPVWDNTRKRCAIGRKRCRETPVGTASPATGRAESLAQIGDPAAAVAEAKSLLDSARGFGPILYRLAALCAVAAQRVVRDTGLAEDERQRRAEQYGTDALDTLRLAREAGFFDDPGNVRRFGEDASWQPLRQRADYREFAKQLGIE